jgi:Methyltransferase domain
VRARVWRRACARVRLIWSLRAFFARHAPELRFLPRPVRRFYVRAWLGGIWRVEPATFLAPASPRQVAALLEIAGRSVHVVELGTAGAMTAIALALAEPGRQVISYDPTAWPFREHSLNLVSPGVRARIELRQQAGEDGPRSDDPAAEVLFVDSSHTEPDTVASFEAWHRSLAPGAHVVFHDYENAEFPGVAAAVRRLGLAGSPRCGMFVWHAPGPDGSSARSAP